MTKPSDLARLGALVADDLAYRGYQAAGVVLQLAQLAASLDDPADEPQCPQCGGPITQPATGRRRTYCSDRCRRAAHRTKPERIARIEE